MGAVDERRTPAGPLLGRDIGMRELLASVDNLVSGRSGCMLVEGPAGIGKTALLESVLDQTRARRVTVAHSRATELDQIAPLRALLRAVRSACPPLLDEAQFADLVDEQRSRFWLLDRLGEVLGEASARQPLLLVMDDAQWCDELTALALGTLVPQLRNHPVLWLLARRPQSSKSPARDALEWLISDGAVRVPLEPLDEPDIAEYCTLALGAPPDARLLDLAVRSGGNPFLLRQLLDTLVAENRVRVADGQSSVLDDTLPATFLTIIARRLHDLSPQARRLIEVGSVFGRPFEVHELAGLMGVPAVHLLQPATEVTETGLLVATESALSFAHDLIREAVYDGLSAPLRQALHREAVEVIRAEGRPVVELAEHLMRGARRGDSRAVSVLREASTVIAQRAPGTAADLLLRACELLDDAADDRAVVADAVRLLAVAGRLSEARELADRELGRALDLLTAGTIRLGLAEAMKHAGEDDGVVDVTGRALSRPGLPDSVRAHLLAIRAHALLLHDPRSAADAGREADSIGTRSGIDSAAAFGKAAVGAAAWIRGELDEAMSICRAAVEQASSAGPEARGRHPGLWLARILTSADRFEEADEILDRGEREAVQLGTAWSLPLWRFYRAELQFARGRLDAAASEASHGLTVAERLGAHALVVPLMSVLALVKIHRADTGSAGRLIAQARRSVDGGIGCAVEEVCWPTAVLALARDEPRAAFEALAPVYEALPDRRLLLVQTPTAAPELVRLAVRQRARGVAERTADAATALAAANPHVASLQGAGAHARGVLQRESRLVGEAVAHYRRARRPLPIARALEDNARLERAADRRADVGALLDEAQTLYRDAGAVADQSRVLATLRTAVGRGSPTSGPRSGWESLTEAELRVVRLVARGRTNREVAGELFLSPHTVDTHLRHAYAKLGVSSRVDVTRRVLEHDES